MFLILFFSLLTVYFVYDFYNNNSIRVRTGVLYRLGFMVRVSVSFTFLCFEIHCQQCCRISAASLRAVVVTGGRVPNL